MSIFKVTNDDVESFTIATNPARSYTSSSLGVTGSLYVYPRRSDVEKDLSVSKSVEWSSKDVNIARAQAQADAKKKVNFKAAILDYMNLVNKQPLDINKRKRLEIQRFTPTFTFTNNTVKKLVTKDLLMPHSRLTNPSANWGYTNYHSLNFFTSSAVNPDAALIYPNVTAPADLQKDGYFSGSYVMHGPFSFDFHINPRYHELDDAGHFKAGTILHLSSCYAISLITGSAKDHNGLPVGFRLQLQLSHSADVSPSLALPGSYPNDLVFLSDDNSLSWNNWHHVVVRWGGKTINRGTGSFNIDGIDRGTFNVFSSTLAPLKYSLVEPGALCVGNYFETPTLVGGLNYLTYFFTQQAAQRDGLVQLDPATGYNEPVSYSFDHPLKAEIHDVAIRRKYLVDSDIAVSSSVGPSTLQKDDYAFYLPPFFIERSPYRKKVAGSGGSLYGGVLVGPRSEVNGTTDDPFNVALAFGAGGHYINIENFLYDFASEVHPRVHQLTWSIPNYSYLESRANDSFYKSPAVRRRNLLLLPCDDGNFMPNFNLLSTEGSVRSAYDDDGRPSPDLIGLSNLLSTSSFLYGAVSGSEATFMSDTVLWITPEGPNGVISQYWLDEYAKIYPTASFGPGVPVGVPLAIFERTRDQSSDQVTFFNISNLFYGDKIQPGSIVLSDVSLSGSGGAFGITLKDDGRGNLYRADCFTSASMFNNVGNVFYDEGILVIKSPHLYFFGKDQFKMTFKGTHNVHTLKFEVIAPNGKLNNSNNESYVSIPASTAANDSDREFVYVSGINFHDKDFNVVARSSLAQPIVKRNGSRILFKVTYDF